MSDFQVTADFTDLQMVRRELVGIGKDAQASARVFSTSYNKVEKELTRTARSSQLYYKSITQANLANKSAAASAATLEREMRRQENATRSQAREVERLSTKYKPLYAASKQYERALEELSAAHNLGIISSQQHENAIDSLTTEYQQFANGAAGWSNQFVQGSNAGGKSANRMGMAIQQAGYQVGDFAVQVQSGQSILVAFSQQATQLVGVLPMVADRVGLSMKAAIGLSAGLGIAIPVISGVAGLLFNMAGGANEAAEEQEELDERIKDTIKTLESANTAWVNFRQGLVIGEEDFLEKLNTSTEELREAQAKVEELSSDPALFGLGAGGGLDIIGLFRTDDLTKAQENLNDAQEEYNNLLAEAQVRSEQLGEDEANNINSRLVLLELERQFGEDSSQVLEERNRLEREAYDVQLQKDGLLETERDMLVELLSVEQNITAEIEAQAAAKEAGNVLASLQEEVALKLAIIEFGEESLQVTVLRAEAERNAFLATVEAYDISAQLKDELIAAYDAANSLSLLDVGAGIRGAITDAKTLATTLWSAASAFTLARAAEGGVSGPDGAVNNMRDQFTPSGISEDDIVSRVSISARTPSSGSSGGGGGGGSSQAAKTLSDIEAEIKAREELAAAVGLEGEQLRMVETITKALGDAAKNYTDADIRASADRLVALQAEIELRESVWEQQQELTDNITKSMADSFTSMIDGTKSVEDAFKDMARNIINELYEVIVMQQIVGSFDASTGTGSGLSGLIGGLVGGLTGSPTVKHAKGDVFTSPIMFPMSGGRTGEMAEDGPEAIMPLKRGSDGKLGVAMSGGTGGGDTVVQQNFYFTANGDESVKQIIAQAAPQIAQMTKKSIIDDRRRGGTTKKAFG